MAVEADRIERKHPLTLEAAISAHQADEMQTMNHQFILPRSLHGTYTVDCHAAGMVAGYVWAQMLWCETGRRSADYQTVT